MNPATKPSARWGHSLAYDSQSDRVILFGGATPVIDDTWAYDFNTNTWTNMNPGTKPSARLGHSIAYDSQSDRVILFGGADSGGSIDDTWAYDLNTNPWTNMTPGTTASKVQHNLTAHDS